MPGSLAFLTAVTNLVLDARLMGGRAAIWFRRQWPEVIGGSAFALALAWYVHIEGVPHELLQQFAVILIGLLAVGFRHLRALVRGVLTDWLPFIGVLVVYDLIRGLSDNWNASHIHLTLQLDADRYLSGGVVPSVWLQQHLAPHVGPVLNDLFALVYFSHFWACLVIEAVLWKTSRDTFRQFVVPYCALTYACLATYLAFPAAPPWMDSQLHLIPSTSRIVASSLAHLAGLPPPTTNWTQQLHSFANPVAAVPSLHAAYPLLLCLFFWNRVPRLRPLLVAYPLAMAFVLVYGAEHFLFDVLLGWCYATAAFVLPSVVRAVRTRLRERTPTPTVEPVPAPATAVAPAPEPAGALISN